MNISVSCFLAAGLMAGSFAFGADSPAPVIPRVLVFSKTLGFRHGSIANGIEAIRDLGAKNGFGVETTEDSSAFTPETLARFRAVVFLSVTGDVLNPDQERVSGIHRERRRVRRYPRCHLRAEGMRGDMGMVWQHVLLHIYQPFQSPARHSDDRGCRPSRERGTSPAVGALRRMV